MTLQQQSQLGCIHLFWYYYSQNTPPNNRLLKNGVKKYKNIQKLVLVDGAAVMVTYLVLELFFLLYEKVTQVLLKTELVKILLFKEIDHIPSKWSDLCEIGYLTTTADKR